MQNVFTETRLDDVDLTKTQPCKYFIYFEQGNPSQALRVNNANSNNYYTMTRFDCNHLAHVTVLCQMQKFLCYCTVFSLFYFDEFGGNFQVQALGGLYLEGRFNRGFFAL